MPPQPLSTADQIQARCAAVIAAGARGDYESGLAVIKPVPQRPDARVVGPALAAAFSDAIHQGCLAPGAVRDGVADVARFAPDERRTFAQVASMFDALTRLQARVIHRAMARRMNEFVTACATDDADQSKAVYDRVVAAGRIDNFLITLWVTAFLIQRHLDAAAASKP